MPHRRIQVRHGWILLLGHALLPTFVQATYSIVALDAGNRQIGAAASTCIQDTNADLFQSLYRGVPGKGVLITQALLMDETEPPVVLGRALLENGTDSLSANEVLQQIVAIDIGMFDPQDGGDVVATNLLRQYGMVTFQGEAAGYTGSALQDLYGQLGLATAPNVQADRQGDFDDYVYSLQGNIVSPETLDVLATNFTTSNTGCDLAEKLFQAVTAVNDQGEGDIRCAGLATAGTLAFVHVEDENGNVLVSIRIGYSENSTKNPFEELQTQFETFRAENPCSSSPNTAVPDDSEADPGPADATTTNGDSSLAPATRERMLRWCCWLPVLLSMLQ